MNWDDLRYALAALRAGTLAGAARSLGVEHSTVGRRLTAVEAALGAPLLTRGPDGLSPTAAGRRVAPLLEQMERAALAAREAVQSEIVRVRLAIPSAFSRFFAPYVGAFREAHPAITLEIMSGSRPVDLHKDEADVALRAGALVGDALVAKKVGEFEWSLYASEAYLARHPAPADPRALGGHELLGFETSASEADVTRWVDRHSDGARVVMRCREVSDLLAACAAGVGLSALPCLLASTEPSLERLTRESIGVSRFWLVYRPGALNIESVRAVIEFMSGALRPYDASRPAGREPRPARR